MSVVASGAGRLQTLARREGVDPSLAEADGALEPMDGLAAGAARSGVGPLRALTRQEGADLPPEGSNGALEPLHKPAHDPAVGVVRSGVGSLRGITHQETAAPALDGADDLLEVAHAPTARLVEQLRQARLRLERAASPELQLSPAIRALLRTEVRLDRPLRLAILGEFNAGKSSLANLLAGADSLPTAVLSNTRFPTLLYYASAPEIWIVHENGGRERLDRSRGMPRQSIFRVEVGLPSPRLRALQVLDLPGFADCGPSCAVVDPTAHNVDAAIWCTVSTQAWKETERVAWEMLPPRIASRGMLVVTHRDLLPDPADRQKLLARLHDDVGTSFRSILFLSTLEALDVMGKDHTGLAGAAWIASGAETLERELGTLLLDLREQRAAAALRMTSRIAQRALIRIDNGLDPALGHAQ